MIWAKRCALLVCSVVAVGAATVPLPVCAQDKAPPGSMPTPVVAVIDFQRVVKESFAGKSVREQLDERRTQYQTEIKEIQKELDAKRSEFSGRLPGVVDDKYDEKRNAMRERVAELQGMVQRRKRELDDMFNVGMRQVDRALVAVLKEMAEEKGINLILNAGRGRGLVLFAESGIIITDEALRRLNERLPKVELTKPQRDK